MDYYDSPHAATYAVWARLDEVDPWSLYFVAVLFSLHYAAMYAAWRWDRRADLRAGMGNAQ
eukprot:gene23230-13943_t